MSGLPYCEPTDWSPDGRHLIVNTRAGHELVRAPETCGACRSTTGGSAEAILSGPFPEYDARISPDGQWLAYVSEETGRPEVSVRAMSGPPRRLVVSTDGGSQPVWRRDGHELLYVDREGHLRGRSVERQPRGELTLGPAVPLNVPLIGAGHWGTQYDVSPDGQRVYFIDRTRLPRGRARSTSSSAGVRSSSSSKSRAAADLSGRSQSMAQCQRSGVWVLPLG